MPGTPPGTSRGLGSLESGNPDLAELQGPKEKTVIISPPLCLSLPPEAQQPRAGLADRQGEPLWKPLGSRRGWAGMGLRVERERNPVCSWEGSSQPGLTSPSSWALVLSGSHTAGRGVKTLDQVE